jgi:hypothetical protein
VKGGEIAAVDGTKGQIWTVLNEEGGRWAVAEVGE